MMNFNTTVSVPQSINIFDHGPFISASPYIPTSLDMAQNLLVDQAPSFTEPLLQNMFKSEEIHPESNRKSGRSNGVSSDPKEFCYVITPLCNLLYCSSSSQELTGYSPEELVGRCITEFIHEDDIDTFIRQFNMGLTRQQSRLYYRFQKKNDEFVMLEVQGNAYYQSEDHQLKYLFCIARPYLSKASSILDAFLELKMENDILKRQLSDLGNFVQDSNWVSSKNNKDSETYSNVFGSIPSPKSTIQVISEQSGICNISRSPIDADINSPEQLKRNYTPDESLGSQDGIPKIKKKKKQKSEDSHDHVCSECGTVESPEWRKGPQGPKTLCNACGLRWAKKTKREQQTFKTEDINS
ncbi:white collar 2 type of transcription factor [Basidiobolus ranarum]|uniref:White collar 2 type of transcription factor n=1 Tax=Basidiobolus ranarum TaxID=34480 RepID=A0ABR2WBW5_9FUNG